MIVGRAVYWHNSAATVTHVFLDGRVALKALGRFPRLPWDQDDDDRASVVEDVLAPSIWWHRD